MDKPDKFRKRPVEVEAWQYVTDDDLTKISNWIAENTLGWFDCTPILRGDEDASWPESGLSIDPATGGMVIATLEGGMRVEHLDFVIRGIKGEFYPCKPDVFMDSYTLVD